MFLVGSQGTGKAWEAAEAMAVTLFSNHITHIMTNDLDLNTRIHWSDTASLVLSSTQTAFHNCCYATMTYTCWIYKNAVYSIYFIMQYMIIYNLVYFLQKARCSKCYSWRVNCHWLYNAVKIIFVNSSCLLQKFILLFFPLKKYWSH